MDISKKTFPILRFNPVYDERIWGGRYLKTLFGRSLPKGVRVGESREMFDFEAESSVVADGKFASRTLRSLIEDFPLEMMGPRWRSEMRFPIIVKLLDARQSLSLQVHPNKRGEMLYGNDGKSEAWYFLNSGKNAGFVAGLKSGVGEAEFRKAMENGDVSKCLCRYDALAGDFILIKAGTVHSLGADNVVLEIQENKTCTFRISDWGRVDANGREREIHVEQSLNSMDYGSADSFYVEGSYDGEKVLCDIAPFRIRKFELTGGEPLNFRAGEDARIMYAVKGTLKCGELLVSAPGCAFVPFAADACFEACGDCTVIVTENFAGFPNGGHVIGKNAE